MKRKNLTLVFNHFEKEHIGKDVFLVPFYLGKQLGYETYIVYQETDTNKNFPTEIQEVKLIPLKVSTDVSVSIYRRNINSLKYIVTHAKKIDLLMCFHHDRLTELRICLYKLFNPRGKVYVKLDIDKPRQHALKITKLKDKLLRRLTKHFINSVDIFSCETSVNYDKLKNSQNYFHQYGDKLILMPNGFDEDQLRKYNIEEFNANDKEDLFITVGRLGTIPKNTEMILEALQKVDLKGWKFYFIGPIEESLKAQIERFYNRCPDKRNSIRFLGPIYDKKILWDYYNKSKVFVFTSRWESYGLVLNEANRFRNYILSTEVGAYYDITEKGKYGISLVQENPDDLANKMQKIINGAIDIDVYEDFEPYKISWEYQIRKLSKIIELL